MKKINKILKYFNLCLLKRNKAEKYIENNYILLLLQQHVSQNLILYKDTFLGETILKTIEQEF